ncbi:MAG: carboxypeptidase regulatory-like domain-containing protein [bacterium]
MGLFWVPRLAGGTRRYGIVVVAGLGLGSVNLAGQTPAGPTGSLAGVVTDAGGAPLSNVEVTLLGESGGARTDSSGRFILRDVLVGGHTALFRRLGFRSVERRWQSRPSAISEISVEMTPLPRQLDRVVVEAPGVSRRRGTSSIGGSVTDSAGRSVAGADVRLLGSGLSTVTDSGGGFEFQLLAAGPYIVRARRQGLAGGNYVMQIGDDDHRGITLKLFGLPPKTRSGDEVASGYGVADAGFDAFDRRLRGSTSAVVLGPADLFRAGPTSLDFLVRQYRDLASAQRRRSLTQEVGAGSSEEGDCLLIDGRRVAYQPVRTFTTTGVQLVEVYRSNAWVDGYVVSQMEGFRECRGSMDRHPTYFVVWTRGLR